MYRGGWIVKRRGGEDHRAKRTNKNHRPVYLRLTSVCVTLQLENDVTISKRGLVPQTLGIPGLHTGGERAGSTCGSPELYGASPLPTHARAVPATDRGRHPVPTCRGGRRPWTRGHNRGWPARQT